MQGLRFALIQMSVGLNKTENVKHACKLIRQAASEGAKLIALPECFNSPYGTKHFPAYAEKIPGPTTSSLSSEAKACQIYLIGGSIPESDTDGKLYNTCTVFNPSGEMIAKFRKMHLFDIDIPGKIRFQESEVLSPGNRFVSFNAGTIKVGLAICYDLRFAEVGQIYAQMGCHLIVYPGAFNMTTGPAHWKLLQRARAVDNQIYIAGVSPARDEGADYIAYGHSMVINPWGEMVASAEAEEKIVYSNLDIERMNEVRRNVPLSSQRRHDIYTTSCQKSNGPLANTQTEKLPFDFSNVD